MEITFVMNYIIKSLDIVIKKIIIQISKQTMTEPTKPKGLYTP